MNSNNLVEAYGGGFCMERLVIYVHDMKLFVWRKRNVVYDVLVKWKCDDYWVWKREIAQGGIELSAA